MKRDYKHFREARMNKDLITYHLKDGLYVMLNKRTVQKFSFNPFSYNIRILIKSLLTLDFKVFRVKKQQRHPIATATKILIRELDQQLLLIDNKEKTIYRKYTNEQQFDRVVKGRETLEIFYNIISISFPEYMLAEEKFFEGITLRATNEEKQKSIIEKVIRKYHQGFLKGEFPTFDPKVTSGTFFNELDKTVYPDEMKMFLYKSKSTTIHLIDNLRWTWAHADLTPENILVNDNDYKVIDSELCEVMPTFYDIANLLNTTATMTGNDTAYKIYFNGTFDYVLHSLFDKESITKDERSVFILVMLTVKNIAQWDPGNKNSRRKLMEQRWNVVKEFIL